MQHREGGTEKAPRVRLKELRQPTGMPRLRLVPTIKRPRRQERQEEAGGEEEEERELERFEEAEEGGGGKPEEREEGEEVRGEARL